jgi:hypothetical protein
MPWTDCLGFNQSDFVEAFVVMRPDEQRKPGSHSSHDVFSCKEWKTANIT